MKITIVGLGYWGPNLIRNFSACDGVTEVGCFDLDEQRVNVVRRRFPHVRTFKSFEEILRSDHDGIALAVPISQHHPLGMAAIAAGKHLLVEKPLAMSVRECADLINEAAKHNRTLMVDHTFVYTGAVRKMKEIVERGEIGDVYYFDSVRVNLGLFQHDVNVLWDLAPHDLSIMDYVLGLQPTGVSSLGMNHYNHMEDVAYLAVRFGDKIMGHVHVNWLSPVKIRRILIGGTKKMVLFDDMEPSEKVKVYDSGVRVVTREGIYKTLVEYRTGDMFAPKLDQTEALSGVVRDFVNAMKTGQRPVSDGESGLRVVRILEGAEESLKNGGKLIQF